MSDELKAAAERIIASVTVLHDEYGKTYLHGEPGFGLAEPYAVAKWTLARLAADEAERAEREKPIDCEWLESVGLYFNGLRYRRVLAVGKYELSTDANGSDVLLMQDDDAIALGDCTRGQLIDLLRALNGGA